MGLSIDKHANEFIKAVNGVVTNRQEQEFRYSDDPCQVVKINFVYDKKIIGNASAYTSETNKFYKFETRNITLWSKIDNLGPSIERGLAKVVYIFSIICGLPFLDWAIGNFRSDHEGRILIAEGSSKAINSIKLVDSTGSVFDLN